MSKQYVRDGNYHIVGSVDSLSDGNQRGYDAHLRVIGRYDCRADRTYDSQGRNVGNGNQLVGLIWQAAGK